MAVALCWHYVLLIFASRMVLDETTGVDIWFDIAFLRKTAIYRDNKAPGESFADLPGACWMFLICAVFRGHLRAKTFFGGAFAFGACGAALLMGESSLF